MPTDKKAKPAHKTTLPYWGIAFFIMGAVVTVVIVMYYFNNRSLINKQIFFLLLILFGTGVSLFLFGSMKSIARISGNDTVGKYYFSGPIVAVLLVVVGWYYLNPDAKSLSLKVRVFDVTDLSPVRGGEVVLYLPGTIQRQPINALGESEFRDIRIDYKESMVRCDVLPDGLYSPVSDTILLTDNTLWNARLQRKLYFTLTGKVTTAASIPIVGAEIQVEGTSKVTRTLSDGSYMLSLSNFRESTLTLIVSHLRFQDKEETIPVSGSSIHKDIILASNKNPDGN